MLGIVRWRLSPPGVFEYLRLKCHTHSHGVLKRLFTLNLDLLNDNGSRSKITARNFSKARRRWTTESGIVEKITINQKQWHCCPHCGNFEHRKEDCPVPVNDPLRNPDPSVTYASSAQGKLCQDVCKLPFLPYAVWSKSCHHCGYGNHATADCAADKNHKFFNPDASVP